MSRVPSKQDQVVDLILACAASAAMVGFVVTLSRCVQAPEPPPPIDAAGPGFYIQSGCAVVYAEGGDRGVLVPNPVGNPDHLFIPPGAVAAWGDPIVVEAFDLY